MTTEEKLLKLRKLADAMYYAANYLTTDASRLHKAMEDYHQFVTNEYIKEEPVSEQKLSNVERIGKNWKEESDLNWKDMSLQEKKDLLALLQKDIEPISEDLEEAIGEYCSNPENFITYIDVGFKQSPIKKDDIPLIIKAIKFGAQWQLNKLKKI